MPISGGDFVDIEDLSGSVEILNGVVGTTAATISGSSSEQLAGISINNTNTGSAKSLFISLDSFTNQWTIPNGSTHFIPLRGNITSFQIKGAQAALDYEIILYKEEP